MAERLRRELYAERGETSRFIDVVISAEGQLIMTAQDVGKTPLEIWGDGDYEFWVVVAAAHKDEVQCALLGERGSLGPLPAPAGDDERLLALIEERYRGDPRAVDTFRTFLDDRDIPCTFGSWV